MVPPCASPSSLASAISSPPSFRKARPTCQKERPGAKGYVVAATIQDPCICRAASSGFRLRGAMFLAPGRLSGVQAPDALASNSSIVG